MRTVCYAPQVASKTKMGLPVETRVKIRQEGPWRLSSGLPRQPMARGTMRSGRPPEGWAAALRAVHGCAVPFPSRRPKTACGGVPAQADRCDAIMARMVYHMIEEKVARDVYLPQLARALRRNGRLLITDHGWARKPVRPMADRSSGPLPRRRER